MSIKYLCISLIAVSFCISFSSSVFAQAYVFEIRGEWKKPNGVIVQNRSRVREGTSITNTSRQTGDYLVLGDTNGKITANCSNGCQSIVVPNAQSWSEYLWCKMIGCGSRRYTGFWTKSGECANFDAIAVVDKDGVTDITSALGFFGNRNTVLNLKLQRSVGDRIYENDYEINTANPIIKGLEVGLYDVVENRTTSRILVLPIEIYNGEKTEFEELGRKIEYWKEKGLSDCTIKSFTRSYIDYVAKRNKAGIKKFKFTGKVRNNESGSKSANAAFEPKFL